MHRALRVRAAQNGRSAEAEIRERLVQAAKPEGRVKLGSLLVAMGRDVGLSDADVDLFNTIRDKTPSEPIRFA